jgi:hypothetical protein
MARGWWPICSVVVVSCKLATGSFSFVVVGKIVFAQFLCRLHWPSVMARETFRLRPESERARYGRRSSEIGVSIDTELPDSSNNAREAAWAAR